MMPAPNLDALSERVHAIETGFKSFRDEMRGQSAEIFSRLDDLTKSIAARPNFSVQTALSIITSIAVLLGMAVGAIVYVAGGRYAPDIAVLQERVSVLTQRAKRMEDVQSRLNWTPSLEARR